MGNNVTLYAITTYDNNVVDAVTVQEDEVRNWRASHPTVFGWDVIWLPYEEAIYYAYIA